MKTLLQAGARVQHDFDRKGWRFCFIGGIANFRWGTPRLTNDLDLTLLTGFGAETSYVDALLSEYDSRIPDAAGFAAENRVVLLTTPDGFALDVALGALPFEASTIDRSSLFEFQPGVVLRTCSAEDLIVHKAFAARPHDWGDVEGVILKRRGELAWTQIWSDLRWLADLKGAPELVDELERIAQHAEKVIGRFERHRSG
jgi:hypothetical protein